MYAQKVGRAQEDCGIRSITAIVIVQATEMQPLTQTIITLMLRKTLCSIRDNIRYGDNRVENDRELYKILDKVTLEDFKDNIEQPLGYQFTDGIQISIGQWQKLALGRTLFKPAEVYIFDEPNASLDIASEQAVLNMIWEEMRDKIAILIIHRFNCMLERADKIIVLENGEIEDIGIQEELLRHHGLYYRLYMVQKEMSLSDE